MEKKSLSGFNRSATFYGSYDAGEVDVSSTPVVVEPEEQLQQLLLYPTVDCFVKIGDSTKEIFVPKTTWTPVSVLCEQFTLRTEGTGKVYWQGWVI
jgi:hypothetical protein